MTGYGSRRGNLVAIGVAAVATLIAVLPVSASAVAHRDPPVVANDGVRSKPLRLVAIIPNSYPNSSQLGTFSRAIPGSTWLKSVQTAYPLYASAPSNSKTKVLFVNDMPGLTTHSRTVGAYQDYVFAKAVAAGLAVDPARQTIYLLFIPCLDPYGMDHFGCSSHHPTINAARVSPDHLPEGLVFLKGDSMAVVLGADLGPDSALDGITPAASHELAEAYTDTVGVGRWNLHSEFPGDPWMDAPPWVRNSGTIELADLSAGSTWFEKDPVSHRTFKYERIYATYRAAHGFNDVAVPSSPYLQYNVSTSAGANGWHVFAYPAAVSLPVDAWAEGSIGSFKVTASIYTFGGNYGSSANGDAAPCTLPTTSWSAQNGSTFQLHLSTVPVALHEHLWCTVRLKSVRSSLDAHDDTFHWWVVGFLVTGP